METVMYFLMAMVAGFLFLLTFGLLIAGILGPGAAAALAPKRAMQEAAAERYESPSRAMPGVSKVVVVERVAIRPEVSPAGSVAGRGLTSRDARALRRETEAGRARELLTAEVRRHDVNPPDRKVWVDVEG